MAILVLSQQAPVCSSRKGQTAQFPSSVCPSGVAGTVSVKPWWGVFEGVLE